MNCYTTVVSSLSVSRWAEKCRLLLLPLLLLLLLLRPLLPQLLPQCHKAYTRPVHALSVPAPEHACTCLATRARTAPARAAPGRQLASAMAMEVKRVVCECHDTPLLCAAYNKARREVYSGAQDSLIKVRTLLPR